MKKFNCVLIVFFISLNIYSMDSLFCPSAENMPDTDFCPSDQNPQNMTDAELAVRLVLSCRLVYKPYNETNRFIVLQGIDCHFCGKYFDNLDGISLHIATHVTELKVSSMSNYTSHMEEKIDSEDDDTDDYKKKPSSSLRKKGIAIKKRKQKKITSLDKASVIRCMRCYKNHNISLFLPKELEDHVKKHIHKRIEGPYFCVLCRKRFDDCDSHAQEHLTNLQGGDSTYLHPLKGRAKGRTDESSDYTP